MSGWDIEPSEVLTVLETVMGGCVDEKQRRLSTCSSNTPG